MNDEHVGRSSDRQGAIEAKLGCCGKARPQAEALVLKSDSEVWSVPQFPKDHDNLVISKIQSNIQSEIRKA